jgi:diadenosine tetraphosphate (Ap4A) HIT family hydrolase
VSGGDVCITCDHNAHFDELPLRERIASDEYWCVAHASGVALLGWLLLVPRRHVTAIADLHTEEAVTLGQWQVRLSRALAVVVGCRKTYIAQFAEGKGFSHVHFHVIPRMPDLPDELRGPAVFTLFGSQDQASIDLAAIDALAHDLQQILQR